MDSLLLEHLETYHKEIANYSLDHDGFSYDISRREHHEGGHDEDEE